MKPHTLLLLLGGTAFAQAQGFNPDQIHGNELTADQAKQVLVVVLRHEHFHLDKRGMDIDGPFTVDPTIPSQRGYWEFGLIFDSPKYGATQVLGRYAVSRTTGDIWQTDLCTHYDFPALRKIQSAIMRKTGKSFGDEKEARRGLGCADE